MCIRDRPYAGRFAQYTHEAAKAAASLAYSRSEFADAGYHRTQAAGHLAVDQDGGANGRHDGGPLEDLLALGTVHFKEFVEQIIRAGDQILNGWRNIVAQRLPKEQRLVLQVGEPAFRGGVA